MSRLDPVTPEHWSRNGSREKKEKCVKPRHRGESKHQGPFLSKLTTHDRPTILLPEMVWLAGMRLQGGKAVEYAAWETQMDMELHEDEVGEAGSSGFT